MPNTTFVLRFSVPLEEANVAIQTMRGVAIGRCTEYRSNAGSPMKLDIQWLALQIRFIDRASIKSELHVFIFIHLLQLDVRF